MPRAPKVLSSRMVFKGHIFGVRRDVVAEPSGHKVTREVVTHHGSVVLVPVFPDGRILLVRQYRHAVGQHLWELMAGRIEPGEAPLAAVKRELVEETGYSARRYQKLVDIYATPGYVNERLVIFAAEGLTPGKSQPDPDEMITTRRFTLAQLESMMRRGALRDAKSIAGVLYYARFVRGKRR